MTENNSQKRLKKKMAEGFVFHVLKTHRHMCGSLRDEAVVLRAKDALSGWKQGTTREKNLAQATQQEQS